MSLQFILAPPGAGKTTHILCEIERHLPDAAPLYFIVPEQFSLQGERLVLAGRTAQVRVQVLSFNRLAYRLFSALGGPPGRMADDLAKSMLLRKILLENADALTYYQSAHDKHGFVDALSATVAELNHYRVTAEDLRARADEVTDGADPTLNAKLTDLALILDAYRETVSGRYLLTDDMLELLHARLHEQTAAIPLLDGAYIWADGFSGFTPQERQILIHLMKRAAYTGITLTTRDTPRRTDPLCAAPRETMQKLTQEATQAGIQMLPALYMEGNHRHARGSQLAVFAEEYGNTGQHNSGAAADALLHPAITLHPAANPYTAILTAAAIVNDWTRKRCWRFADIAVLCGDRSLYEKTLRTVFDRLNIPLFVDTEVSILTHPLTELIRAAFEIIVRNFSYESVFRFLKTGLTGIAQDEIDVLENYALAHGISGYRWRYEMNDPRAEAARKALMTALTHLPRPQKKMRVTEFSHAVFRLLDALNVPAALARQYDEALAAGNAETARLHKQIWPKICEVFDKLVEILGDVPVTAREYAATLEAGLAGTGMGRIPPTLDQVVLGDAARSRYPAIKGMIVLGANDGVLPAPPAAPGLFTDDEREILRNTALELAADLPARITEQNYALYCALCQPSHALALITAENTSAGKPLRPAPIIRSLRGLFPELSPTQIALPHEYTPLDTPPPGPARALSAQTASDFFGKILHTSASRLEAYAGCPFAYFLAYMLKAKPRKHYEVLPTDLGSLFHAVVAAYAQQHGWQPRPRGEIDALVAPLVAAHAPHETAYHATARNRYILEKAHRVCTASIWAITEHIKADAYTPAFAEIELPEAPPVILDNGVAVVLRGRIDRADLHPHEGATYVKIIDYKSKITRLKPEEIRNGTRLQLPLYLSAMLRHPQIENAKPGELEYFPIDDPIVNSDIALSEAARDAALIKAFKPASTTPTDEMLATAHSALRRLAMHMTSGYIPAAPCPTSGKSPCEYCKYSAVCGHTQYS